MYSVSLGYSVFRKENRGGRRELVPRGNKEEKNYLGFQIDGSDTMTNTESMNVQVVFLRSQGRIFIQSTRSQT